MSIDLSFNNKRKPSLGRVLLADPFTQNEYFGRSVIYLCEHNENGSFGFVLTNYLDVNLADVAKNFPSVSSRISVGGPVQTDRIFFLHTLGDELPGSLKIEDGLYMGGDYGLLMDKIKNDLIDTNDVRFFLGYSGWDPGQLEEEINRKSWIVASVLNPLEVMDTSVSDIWNKFMKREGKKYDILARSPIDFTAN
jgi:putative transcriptional regulator